MSTIGAAAAGLLILRFLAPRDNAPPQGRARKSDNKTGFADKEHVDPNVAKREEGTGRHAESPEKIPARGWKDVLWRTYQEIGKDKVLAVAAGVTYYALLGIFPAVAALVSMYGLFADPSTIQEHLNALSGVLPAGAIEIVGDQVKRIASQGEGTLGFSFVIGLLIALWSANAGMKAIFDALNIVYDEEEKRGFIKLNAVSLAFTAGALLFVLLAIAAIIVLPILLKYLGLETAPNGWCGLAAGQSFSRAWSAVWRFSTDTVRLRPCPVAVGHSRRSDCRRIVGCRVRPVLLVRGEFRELQRDLRVVGGGYRFHDLDLGVRHRDFVGRRDQRRSRSIRRCRTRPKGPETPWVRAAQPWRTPSARAKRSSLRPQSCRPINLRFVDKLILNVHDMFSTESAMSKFHKPCPSQSSKALPGLRLISRDTRVLQP